MRNVLRDQDVFFFCCQVVLYIEDINGLYAYSWCCFGTEAVLHALVIRRLTDDSQGGVSEAEVCRCPRSKRGHRRERKQELRRGQEGIPKEVWLERKLV